MSFFGLNRPYLAWPSASQTCVVVDPGSGHLNEHMYQFSEVLQVLHTSYENLHLDPPLVYQIAGKTIKERNKNECSWFSVLSQKILKGTLKFGSFHSLLLLFGFTIVRNNETLEIKEKSSIFYDIICRIDLKICR